MADRCPPCHYNCSEGRTCPNRQQDEREEPLPGLAVALAGFIVLIFLAVSAVALSALKGAQ